MTSDETVSARPLQWVVKPAAAFHTLQDSWNDLAAAAGGIPFLHADFVAPLLREFGSGRERVILGMGRDGPVAAAIVAPLRLGVWQTFQPSQLPLGAVVAAQGASVRAISRDMLRALPASALQLGITQIDPVVFPRPQDTATSQTLDYIDTAWIDVEGEFDGYWARRGKNLRQNMAKQRRKLETDGIRAALDVLTTSEEVAQGLRDYAQLESSGWKAEGGTAVDLATGQGRFYAAMLSAFAKRGAARVYRYRFNERPVAVDLCVEAGPMQVVLKTTYDESIKGASPAFLMRQDALMLEWPTRRVRRIEFYGRRMEWHARWTDNCRTLYHLNQYRWSWLSRWRRSRNARHESPSSGPMSTSGSR